MIRPEEEEGGEECISFTMTSSGSGSENFFNYNNHHSNSHEHFRGVLNVMKEQPKQDVVF